MLQEPPEGLPLPVVQVVAQLASGVVMVELAAMAALAAYPELAAKAAPQGLAVWEAMGVLQAMAASASH